jgi:ribulose-phosphate 3-epimerase
MQIKIAPSILAADFSVMGEAIKKLNEAGADVIHCDVMDGTFVGPITFGSQMIKNIRKLTNLPLDAHLMVEHPQTQIKFFAEAGADIITVHYEACKKISPTYLTETLNLIKSYGVKCGVVVNPDTDVENIFDVLPAIDMLVIMSVFPGYGGQKFIPTALEQTKKARAKACEIGRPDLDIEIDGGVTTENIADIKKAGANVIVAGSTVFKATDMSATIKALRG